MDTTYTYTFDFFRADGAPLGQQSLQPDWSTALEWVHFEGIREGRLPPVQAASRAAGAFRIDPVWHARLGAPYVSAFRITLPGNGRGPVWRDIPTAYVRDQARRVSSAYVEQGRLRSGEQFHYLVSAFAGEPAEPAGEGPGADFGVEELAQPLPLLSSALAEFVSASVPAGAASADGDFPVFIPQAVLDETLALSRQAGDVETGGVLVGALHTDPTVPEVFVEVTAQIAAPHTEAAAAKLTFTPETWAAVRATLALRKRGELMVGWWHYHPDFCRLRNCPEENRRRCTMASAFFSSEDVALHTALFARGFNTALLVSDSADSGLTTSLFGWRQGMVVSRIFATLERTIDHAGLKH